MYVHEKEEDQEHEYEQEQKQDQEQKYDQKQEQEQKQEWEQKWEQKQKQEQEQEKDLSPKFCSFFTKSGRGRHQGLRFGGGRPGVRLQIRSNIVLDIFTQDSSQNVVGSASNKLNKLY